ncbi:MAG: glycerophosphodiester phosphodiesterase family protein [Thermodesulfobacteriota bacterium]
MVRQIFFCLLILCGWTTTVCGQELSEKQVAATGGEASVLAPNSLVSLAMAATAGADIIEIGLTMSSDGRIIVFSDPGLDRLTDVRSLFPGRQSDEGLNYPADFTLDQIRSLKLKPETAETTVADGFETGTGHLYFTIATLEEVLELVRLMERDLARSITLIAEIKRPWLHKREGRDLSLAVLKIFNDFGYRGKEDHLFLQCYDPDELKRIKTDLFGRFNMDLPLIQLIDENGGTETMVEEWGRWVPYNYDWIFTRTGIRSMAALVAGVGLDEMRLVNSDGTRLLADFVAGVHDLEMKLHVLGVNKNDSALSLSFEERLELFWFELGADVIHTASGREATRYLFNRPEKTLVPPESSLMGHEPPDLFMENGSERKNGDGAEGVWNPEVPAHPSQHFIPPTDIDP